jgi:hypothetical protein
MLINLLVTDHWVGRSNGLRYEEAATWEMIEAAIRRLDGRQHTEVAIEKVEEDSDVNEGEVVLSVGGGPDRFLVVFRAQDGSEFLPAVGNDAGGTCALVIGGQSADFPADITMNLEGALEVARQFAGHSQPSEPSGWVKRRD